MKIVPRLDKNENERAQKHFLKLGGVINIHNNISKEKQRNTNICKLPPHHIHHNSLDHPCCMMTHMKLHQRKEQVIDISEVDLWEYTE